MVAADSDRIPRVPPYSGGTLDLTSLPVRDFHPRRPVFPERFRFASHFLWTLLQPRIPRKVHGLGSSHFDRHYFGNRDFFLFLQVLRCFSSLRTLQDRSWRLAFNQTGSPIRTSPDQFLFADPRGFSQLTTSFFGSGSLGILRSLLFSFSYSKVNFAYS